MKKYLLALLFLSSLCPVFSQKVIRCHTMPVDSQLRVKYGMESLQDFENWMQAKLAIYKASEKYTAGQRSVVTIPIVFHVIHQGENAGTGTNLSQAQINSQIDVLNEDFRRMAGTRGYNTNAVGADCEIEFCPAVVDPAGNILTEPGIDRVNKGSTTWTENSIEGTLKPQTIWDPERYFNVWTTSFGGSSAGILGYAQFPNSSGLQGISTNNGSANTDGVVLWYKCVGRTGNLDPTYRYGRTLTHEVGHFLGLRHIWGDQTCGNDYCNDTPKAEEANYGCPNHITCNNTVRDMVENYMDYTNDGCMNLFTQNQKDRMWTVLTNSPRRASLTSSNVCTIPFTFSYTGRVVDANNQGIANAQVFLDGPADYRPVTDANGYFTIPNLQQDNYTAYAGKWGYITNFVSQQPYTPNTPAITIVLQTGYYDDFLLDFSWSSTGTAATGKWVRGIPSGTAFTTGGTTYASNPGSDVNGDYGNYAFVTGNGGGGAGDDDVDDGTAILTSPAMDLSAYSEPVLRYYRWFFNKGGTGTPNDSLIISLNNNGQVIELERIGQATVANQWTYKSYRIKNYIPNPGTNITLQVRTFDVSASGHLVEAGLDLFKVIDSTGVSSQPPVANFSSNATTICAGSSVSFNDLSSNNPTGWDWVFQGGFPASSNSSNPVIRYNTPGIYPVTLTATNTGGSDTVAQTAYIKVEPIVAQFTQDKTGVCPGAEITFENGSSCTPTTIKWSFPGADVTTSTDQSPVISYSTPGYYDVTLIAGNQYGYDTLTQNLAVHVFANTVMNATATNDTNNLGLGSATVNITSGTSPYTYSWSDPLQQTTQTATGLVPGLYQIKVTDGNGCSSYTTIRVNNITIQDTTTTAIDDVAASSFMRAYPNPVTGRNMFLVTGKNWMGSKAELTDALGRTIGRYDIVNEKTEISFSGIVSGVYFLRLNNGKQTSVIRLIRE